MKSAYYENRFEHALVYERGKERVEMALIHLPGTKPVLKLATFAENNPDAEPSNLVEFSEEEIQLRNEFVSRLREAGVI